MVVESGSSRPIMAIKSVEECANNREFLVNSPKLLEYVIKKGSRKVVKVDKRS